MVTVSHEGLELVSTNQSGNISIKKQLTSLVKYEKIGQTEQSHLQVNDMRFMRWALVTARIGGGCIRRSSKAVMVHVWHRVLCFLEKLMVETWWERWPRVSKRDGSGSFKPPHSSGRQSSVADGLGMCGSFVLS